MALRSCSIANVLEHQRVVILASGLHGAAKGPLPFSFAVQQSRYLSSWLLSIRYTRLTGDKLPSHKSSTEQRTILASAAHHSNHSFRNYNISNLKIAPRGTVSFLFSLCICVYQALDTLLRKARSKRVVHIYMNAQSSEKIKRCRGRRGNHEKPGQCAVENRFRFVKTMSVLKAGIILCTKW